MPLPTPELVKEVFEPKLALFNDDKDLMEKCEELCKKLTEEELEQAACTSYCYWYVFNFPHSDGDDAWKSLGDDQSTIRLEMAKREARRHFLSEDKNMDKSLKTLKDSLVWRKSKNIDELRLCFASEDVKARISDESLKSRVEEMEKHVTKELVENQPSFAAGYDLKGAAYAVREPRSSPNSTAESGVYGNVYVLERCIAMTELKTKGTQEHFQLFANLTGTSKKNMPERKIGREIVEATQSNYPLRLTYYMIIWLNMGLIAKGVVKFFWSLLKPILNKKTSEVVHFKHDEQARDDSTKELVSPEEATDRKSVV